MNAHQSKNVVKPDSFESINMQLLSLFKSIRDVKSLEQPKKTCNLDE